MVFQLLVFRCFVSHQGASREQQVGAGCIQAFVNQKVFLFPAEIGHHFLYFRVEIVTYIHGCLVYGSQCFQEGSLVIQRLSCIGDENRWNAKCIVNNEYGR